MPGDADGKPESNWLIEPPGANEIFLHVAVGESVGISAEARQALEKLLDVLQSGEVEGYGKCFPKCSALNDCGVLACYPLNNCTALDRMPCAMKMTCEIKRIG